MKTTKLQTLRTELFNTNDAIRAFSIGCPWLSPDGLAEAPSLAWLKMQKNTLVRQIAKLKGAA